MILELLVSTIGKDGQPNFSPMGVIVEDDFCWMTPGQSVELRPFHPSSTLENLCEQGKATLQVVGDTVLIAGCLLKYRSSPSIINKYEELKSHPDCHSTRFHRKGDLAILESASVAVEILPISFQEQEIKTIVKCQTGQSYVGKPFQGMNRAKNAILEMVILGTRLDRTPAAYIEQKLQELQPIVNRTGSALDIEVWNWMEDWFGVSS